MAQVYEQRTQFRRFTDRRGALMLAVYEILFDLPRGANRDGRILEAILRNYGVDRAAFVSLDTNPPGGRGVLATAVGSWNGQQVIQGRGFDQLLALHREVDGALTFESVRRPTQFSPEEWDSLWSEALGGASRALLSMEVRPSTSAPKLIWLQQILSSREWSSRDRELIEEVAALLARAEDKKA